MPASTSSAIVCLFLLVEPVEAPIPEPPTIVEFKRRDEDADGVLTRNEYVKPNIGTKWEEAAKEESVRFDRNRDGRLSLIEFAWTPPGQAEPAIMFRLLDGNRDGTLEHSEFTQRNPPGYDEASRLEFAHFDADGSGGIEQEEYLLRGAAVAGGFVQRFFERDSDDDGRMSREEYVRPNIGGKWEEAAKSEAVQYDMDGDGYFTAAEFARTPPAEASPAMRFALGDADRNGSLDRDELAGLSSPTGSARSRSRVPSGARSTWTTCRFDGDPVSSGGGRLARVLIIGDTHCPGMRAGYVDFLKRVADDYAVTRIVHIGDLVDWASISYHEKSPSLRNAALEYTRARQQVAALARAFPQADWLIGNHDALTERQAVTAGLPPELLRDYADMWDVGWSVHPRFTKLLIDGVVYAHGDSGRGGEDAAFRQAKDNFRSTVIGHFHHQAGVRWWANREFRVFGLSVGCGIDAGRMQFEYGRRFAHKPILGCGVVLGGRRAYFEPWLLRSR